MEQELRVKKVLEDIKSPRIKKVILDADTGADGDDQFAIAYALAAPDKVDVVAVNSAPFNDEPADFPGPGKEENKKIISLSGYKKHVPAYMGCQAYIKKTKAAVDSEAVDNIIRIVHESDEFVYVIVSGCSTNVASAIMKDESIKEKLVVVWLATFDIYGDTNGYEYNFLNDNAAGEYIFHCGVSLVSIPVRLASPFKRSDEEVAKMYNGDNPLCEFLVKRYEEITWGSGLWDLGAEGAIICPEAYEFKVVDGPIFDDKLNVIDFDKSRKIIYVQNLDNDKVVEDSINRINNIHNN